jgi:hypothetical protein
MSCLLCVNITFTPKRKKREENRESSTQFKACMMLKLGYNLIPWLITSFILLLPLKYCRFKYITFKCEKPLGEKKIPGDYPKLK